MQIHWGKLSLGCRIDIILALIIFVPLCCFLTWIIGIKLEAQGYVPYIQQALDEQCGEGVVIADAEGFNGDQGPSWSSGEQRAHCTLSVLTESGWSWVCYCLEPLTPTPTNTPDSN